MTPRHGLSVLLVCALCLVALVPAAGAAPLSAKKTAILDYLHTLESNRQTLSGVQVNEYEVYLGETSEDRLRQRTGKAPAVLGLELMGAIAFAPYKTYVYDRAVRHTANGGLVALTWHERNPLCICVRGEFFDCVQRPMSAAALDAVLREGTPEHAAWIKDVDAIARVLKGFVDRGVVVLFRPYHEMNGGWFWWGKQDAYPKLWDALYDELVVRRGLTNMIWVWSSDRATPDVAKYVPVRHMPDVSGIDVYETDRESPVFRQGAVNVRGAFGKKTPFAITEVGLVPSVRMLEEMNPAWVLLWGGEYIDKTLVMKDPCNGCNTAADIDALLKLQRFVSREEIPAGVRARISDGVSVDPSTSAALSAP